MRFKTRDLMIHVLPEAQCNNSILPADGGICAVSRNTIDQCGGCFCTCTDCTDCTGCTNCTGCTGCTGCTATGCGCTNCSNCSNLTPNACGYTPYGGGGGGGGGGGFGGGVGGQHHQMFCGQVSFIPMFGALVHPGDLALLKDALRQSIARVESQEAALAQAKEPETVEQLDELERKLRAAIDELTVKRETLAGKRSDH
jgi:hypothetical protein